MPTRTEIEAELIAVNFKAKRCLPVVGDGRWPHMDWDRTHDYLDCLLEDWEEAGV